MKFYALNVVVSLSDWTWNDEFFGIHKSLVNTQDPRNISPPVHKPPNIGPPKNVYKPL